MKTPAKEVPTLADQPVQPEQLRALWVQHLELQNRKLDLLEQRAAYERDVKEFEARIAWTLKSAGVELSSGWEVNFRDGTMTKKDQAREIS